VPVEQAATLNGNEGILIAFPQQNAGLGRGRLPTFLASTRLAAALHCSLQQGRTRGSRQRLWRFAITAQPLSTRSPVVIQTAMGTNLGATPANPVVQKGFILQSFLEAALK
jgi:hypothetical protein